MTSAIRLIFVFAFSVTLFAKGYAGSPVSRCENLKEPMPYYVWTMLCGGSHPSPFGFHDPRYSGFMKRLSNTWPRDTTRETSFPELILLPDENNPHVSQSLKASPDIPGPEY